MAEGNLECENHPQEPMFWCGLVLGSQQKPAVGWNIPEAKAGLWSRGRWGQGGDAWNNIIVSKKQDGYTTHPSLETSATPLGKFCPCVWRR